MIIFFYAIYYVTMIMLYCDYLNMWLTVKIS